MAWEGSTRSSRLPSWWPAARAETLAAQPTCRCDGCLKCTPVPGGPCRRRSEEVDHIVAGDDHSPANRRGICRPCHGHKSSTEGNAARRRRTDRALEPHPGRLT